jgi:hypothetical protein
MTGRAETDPPRNPQRNNPGCGTDFIIKKRKIENLGDEIGKQTDERHRQLPWAGCHGNIDIYVLLSLAEKFFFLG